MSSTLKERADAPLEKNEEGVHVDDEMQSFPLFTSFASDAGGRSTPTSRAARGRSSAMRGSSFFVHSLRVSPHSRRIRYIETERNTFTVDGGHSVALHPDPSSPRESVGSGDHCFGSHTKLQGLIFECASARVCGGGKGYEPKIKKIRVRSVADRQHLRVHPAPFVHAHSLRAAAVGGFIHDADCASRGFAEAERGSAAEDRPSAREQPCGCRAPHIWATASQRQYSATC